MRLEWTSAMMMMYRTHTRKRINGGGKVRMMQYETENNIHFSIFDSSKPITIKKFNEISIRSQNGERSNTRGIKSFLNTRGH